MRISSGFGAMLAAFLVLVFTDSTPQKQLGQIIAIIVATVGFVAYVLGCTAWAEAKGYSSSIAVGLIAVGALCLIIFALILPPVVLFVLEDKAAGGRRHHSKWSAAKRYLRSRFQKEFTRKQQLARAVIGLVIGLGLAVVSAIAGYFDYKPGIGTRWGYAIAAALPIVGWACTHLARYRGYPSTAAYGLLFFGLCIAGFVVRGGSPVMFGFMILFVELLAVIVLLVLPGRSGRLRVRRHEPQRAMETDGRDA